jgi:two-component system, LytTR family, sensor kinase
MGTPASAVSWLSGQRLIAVAVTAATLVGGLNGIQRLVLRQARDLPLQLLETVGVQLVPWYVWAALVPFMVAICRRLPVTRTHVATTIGTYALLGVIASVVHTALIVLPIGWLSNWTTVSWPPLIGFTQLIVNRGVMAWTEFALIVAILQTAITTQQTRERDAAESALREQLVDAELRALRMQLEPHFLFNTLNAIQAHVRDTPAVAEAMLGHLSAVLRAVLASSEHAERPLGDELALVRRLLSLHEVRFGNRLQVSISTDDVADRALVPTLLLQPLVENAIVHGVSQRPGPVRIDVSAARANGQLVVCVSDSGAAHVADSARTSGHRIGLANARQRLAHRYGDQCELRIEQQATETRATVRLPYSTQGVA